MSSTCAGTATFDTANVGTGKTVTVSGHHAERRGGGQLHAGVSTTATTTADITAVTLTATVTAANKVYDGDDGGDGDAAR